jgi:hypothetical protein
MVSSHFNESTRWILKSFTRSEYCKLTYDDRWKLNIIPKITLDSYYLYAWIVDLNHESIEKE